MVSVVVATGAEGGAPELLVDTRYQTTPPAIARSTRKKSTRVARFIIDIV